jgi:hypothetical protein
VVQEAFVGRPDGEIEVTERIMVDGGPTEPLELLLSLVERSFCLRLLLGHVTPFRESRAGRIPGWQRGS